MRQIILSGYFGFANAGDEAILAALVEGIRDELDTPEIVVLSANPERTAQKHGVRAIGRYNYKQLFSSLKETDLLVSGGGSLLQDVTSRRTIPYYLSIIMLAKLLGVPVFCCAQGVGPVKGSFNRQLVKRILNRVDKITVRDQPSQELLKKIGVAEEVELTADPVFTLQPSPSREVENLLATVEADLTTPVIGVSVRPWQDNSYLPDLAELLLKLQSELSGDLVLLPFQLPGDRELSRKLNQLLAEQAVLLTEDYSPRQILGLIANFDLLVGVRLHSLIFAVIQQVVPLGISYDPKVDNFLAQLDLEPLTKAESFEVEAVYRRALDLWGAREEIEAKAAKKFNSGAGLARRNLELIRRLSKS